MDARRTNKPPPRPKVKAKAHASSGGASAAAATSAAASAAESMRCASGVLSVTAARDPSADSDDDDGDAGDDDDDAGDVFSELGLRPIMSVEDVRRAVQQAEQAAEIKAKAEADMKKRQRTEVVIPDWMKKSRADRRDDDNGDDHGTTT